MAEYYPLLAKAIGSLPNSTPETRRVVYERARKALIGQLRTLHPPLPDSEIENESLALDRAIERLESELAQASPAVPVAPASPAAAAAGEAEKAQRPAAKPVAKAADVTKGPVEKPADRPTLPPKPSVAPKPVPKPPLKGDVPPVPSAKTPPSPTAEVPAPGLAAESAQPAPGKPPIPPLKTRPAKPKPGPAPVPVPPAGTNGGRPAPVNIPVPATPPAPPVPPGPPPVAGPPAALTPPAFPPVPPDAREAPPTGPPTLVPADGPAADKPSRLTPQRPIAPQAPLPPAPKRRLWIIPLAVVVLASAVGFAAYKLRDRPETLVHSKANDTPTQAESGKIAERVGAPSNPAQHTSTPAAPKAPTPQQPPAPEPTQQSAQQTQPAPQQQPQSQPQPQAPANSNPEVPVAHRAALLVEAPNEPNKVKTYLGTVVWKLNNAPQGQSDSVGLAVEADIDMPDDKLKAIVTFAKNTDASLPASHTINVRFMPEPGSATGDVKQISVPQMRAEASPSGDPLAGVTVPIVANSFLVGLSPGNEETANTELMRRQQWVDIPMLLESGKIAKLTFEKGESGQRDMAEALDAWNKQ